MSGITVIIPVYNRTQLIAETLGSLLNQTVPADEIIVVDDGSTDDTAKAAQAAFAEWESGKVKGQKSPEFRVIAQENAGPAKARNIGFAASKGQFIHFFDSDDLAAPNKHEVQLKALEETGADIAYGPWVKGRFSERKFTPANHVLQQWGLPDGDLIKALLTNWSIVSHACLFRRSIVENSGGFPEHLFVAEDQMMFLNCLLAGARVVHSPGTLELYRIGDHGKITAHGEGQKRQVLNWARFLIDADLSCRKHGITTRKWFGFCSRALEVIEDCRKLGIDDTDLIIGLKEILGKSTPPSFYKTLRLIDRKYISLKARITGGRGSSSFRMGPITKEQKILIENMGLKIGAKKTR